MYLHRTSIHERTEKYNSDTEYIESKKLLAVLQHKLPRTTRLYYLQVYRQASLRAQYTVVHPKYNRSAQLIR